MNRSLSLSLVALISLGLFAQAQETSPLSEAGQSLGLSLTIAAEDLAFPMGMAILDDGSLLVATSPSESGNFYDSNGAVLRLADSDADGLMDTRTVVADGLPGSLVALVTYEDIVIVTSAES